MAEDLKVFTGQRQYKRPKAPSGDGLTCPNILVGEARREWKRIVNILREMETLSTADRSIMTAYCQAWGDFREAVQRINDGAPRYNEGTNVVVIAPAEQQRRNALKEVERFAKELGLTPGSRSRLKLGGMGGNTRAKGAGVASRQRSG